MTYMYIYIYTRLDLSIDIDRKVEQLLNGQLRSGSSVPVTLHHFCGASHLLTWVTKGICEMASCILEQAFW